jgi:hypothetical protein
MKSVRLYRSVGNQWVLESWRMPELGRARHEQLGLVYPERGEYYFSEVLPGGPEDWDIGKVISWIEAGRYRNPNENPVSIKEAYQKEDAAARSNLSDAIRDKFPAYGLRPFAARGGSRGTKTSPIVKSANDLRLRIASGTTGKMVQGSPRVTLETR